MRRLIIPAILLLIFLTSAFSGDSVNAQSPVSSSDTLDTSTDSILKYWLRERAVSNEKPFHKTFWCWLGTKELDTVAQLHSLLWDFKPHDKSEILYSLWLQDHSQDQNPYVKILRSSSFLRTQSAWPNYWASVQDRTEPQLGNMNQLVQVELEDSSLIAVFFPQEKGEKTIRVFDLSGNPVSLPEFEKNQTRLAAVFIAGKITGGIQNTNENQLKKTEKKQPYPFRTFVLCNEKMIRSWHHAVPGMQHQQALDMNYLMLLYAWTEAHPEKSRIRNPKKFPACWNALSAKSPIMEYYSSTQKSLRPGETNMQTEMRSAIDYLRSAWKNQVKPMERFPSKGMR